VTLAPTTLTASRTLTLPDASGTVLQSGTTVTTAQGGTGLTSFTANGVVYASSSSALATGSALTFDGTNFVTTGSATGTAFIPSGSTVPTNGMYLPTTNTVAWSTNTTERMRLDSSGNLGIGTTSPAFRTDVINNSTYQLRVATNTSNYSSGGIYFGASGTSDPYYYGAVSWNQSDITMRLTANCGNNSGGMAFYISGSSAAPTERMRLDYNGNLGIGTTSPSASAILDAQSTTKGVRMPNMTTTQKNAISSPAAGLMVFDTTLAKLCVYSGSAWQTITSV
jgi:hypothetical protein